LLGPLLADPTVHLVRGAYDREATFDGRLRPAGGGRVTELVARPLINLFWPDLAAVQQPLGGEYAARRETLLTLPFPCGYGVELGLLVDVWATRGLDAIAQVDLGTRRHRHQRDEALSLMSSALMQIALNRLERTGRLALAEPPSTEFARPVRAADGWAVQRVDVTEHERPPMAGLLAQHAAV
jgi:glucosyl-3-phosphoglycerate synthase